MKGITGASSSKRPTKGILRKPTFLSSFLNGTKSTESVADSVDIVMKQKYGNSTSFLEENDGEERLAVIINRAEIVEKINPYADTTTKRISPTGVNDFFEMNYDHHIPINDNNRSLSFSSKEISCIEGGDEDEDDIHFCHIPDVDSVNGSNVIDKIEISETYGAKLREIVAGIDSTVLLGCHSDEPCREEINDDEDDDDDMMSLIVESCSVGTNSLKEIINNIDNNEMSMDDLQNSIMLALEAIDTRNISAGEYLSQGKTQEAMEVYEEAVNLAKRELQHIKHQMKRQRKEKNISNSSGILELDDEGNLINDSDFLLDSSTFVSPKSKLSRNNYLESHYESLTLSIAHILNNLGVVQEMCEQYDKSLKSCRESLKAYRDIHASSSYDTENEEQAQFITRTINNIAQILRAKESHAKRKKLELDAQQLLNKFHRLNGNKEDSYADLEKSFLLNESLQLYKELYKLECSTLGTTHPNLAKTLHSMGKLRWTLLQHEKLNVVDQNATSLINQHAAIKEIVHARKLIDAAYGPHHPMLIYILRDLAKFYHEIEMLLNALELYKEVLSLERRYSTKGNESIDYAFTLANIGDIQLHLGDVPKSIEALHEAEAVFKQNSSHAYTCKMNTTLGNLYFKEMRDYPKSITCFSESLHGLLKKADDVILHGREIVVNKYDHNLQVASALSNLGMVYCAMEEFTKGISCYKEAFQIRMACNTSLSSDDTQEMKATLAELISYNLFNIGEAYFGNRQYKKSMLTYKTLLRFTRKSFVDSKNYNIPTAKCLERIGYIHVELKEKEESLICWNEALRLLKDMDHNSINDESKLLIDRICSSIEKVNVASLVSKDECNLLPPSSILSLSTVDNVECIYGGHNNGLQQNNECALTVTITEYDNKAQMFLQQGDTKKAIKYLFKALDIRRQQQHKLEINSGDNDQELNNEYKSNIDAYSKNKNEDQGINMEIAWNLFLIGIVYQYQKDNVAALIFFNESMRIYKDIFHFDDDHSLVIAVQNKISALSK